MTSQHPHPSLGESGQPTRRRVAGLLVVGGLVGLLVMAVTAGWAGWLVEHPEQAWAWIRRRWFAASALSVFVAVAGVVVAVVMPRWQQRRTERLAIAQQRLQQAQAREQLERRREEQAAARRAAWVRRCQELVAIWPLPELQQVNPFEIGVFWSRRADVYRGQEPRPPYVPRVADKELAELLRSKLLVLVKGQSRAGKSRTAFEVAAQELAGWRLLIPKDRAALAALGELDPLPDEGQRVLVWLDDLEQYLAVEGTSGLDMRLLARLADRDPPAKVLATMRLEEYARLAATPGELGRSVRDLLNRFDPGALTLPVGFDESAEQAAIGVLYPGEQVNGGLAEHLAAVHELVDRLEAGEAGVPEGAGLVLAAVDWRRAGLERPISREELAELLPLYLKRLRPLMPLVREGDLDLGLRWAAEPVGRTAALLVADPEPLAGTFRVADPVVDYVERRTGRRLGDPAVWEKLLSRASPEEAMDMAIAAWTRKEWEPAEAALRQVLDSGSPDGASRAAFNLGVVLSEQGDVAGAQTAFEEAINSGHHEAAPMAAFNLGTLLKHQGDVADARAAYQQAIYSGHHEAAPRAAFNLGLLLAEQGDVPGAQAAYQQAINSGHHEQASLAAFNLGVLLKQQGDVAGARAAFQEAIDSRHQDVAPRAAFGLGMLLEEQGDADGAKAAYQRTIDSDHPDVAPAAAVILGVLVQGQGDLDGAKAAYHRAIDFGHPDATPRAAALLGSILAEQGDVVGARKAYQQAINAAIDADQPEDAAVAALGLGVLLQDQGDLSEAKDAYYQARDLDGPDVREAAEVALLRLAMRERESWGRP